MIISGEHGTHVCGTTAGGDASGQWIGMAPEAKLAVAQSNTQRLQDLLTGSVDELGEAGHDSRYGFGRLNILRAIALAKTTPLPPPA